MGRKKKSLIEKSPFKLRHRKLADGRLSLFLDRSVDGGHEYEFLQLYLMPETSAKARRQNAQTLRKAEDIQRERTEACSRRRWKQYRKANLPICCCPTGCPLSARTTNTGEHAT